MPVDNRTAPPIPSFIAVAEEQREHKTDVQPQPTVINVERIDRNINHSLRKQIVDIITKNPDFALSILRGWRDR